MDQRAREWQDRLEWPMVIAALMVIPVLVIEEANSGQPWDAIGQVLNWVSWLAFVGEAVIMIRVTPRPWDWIKRHPIDVAVIFLTPPFIPRSLEAARLFRLLRLLRLLRIFSLRRLLSLEGIRSAAFIVVFVILIGGAAYAAIEKTDHHGNPLSYWDGIWWAVTTVTTVGYGDSYPTTDAGRAIAMVVMAVGIGFVALLTAFVAERFIRQDPGRTIEAREDRVLAELGKLRAEVRELRQQLDSTSDTGSAGDSPH